MFITLNQHPDYEILNEAPFTVRRISNHKVVKTRMDEKGYIRLYLNQRSHMLHRVIAEQFIPNPLNLPQIDHINHIKDDNRIENLRWCTNKDNTNNRKTYAGRELIYVDEINENAIEVEYYGEHRFENYYFYDNFFYLYNGIQYKRIITLTDPYGLCYADLVDVDNKKVHVRFNKFKKLYNII